MTRSGLRRLLLAVGPPIAVGLLAGLLGLELLARSSWEESWRDPSQHGGPEGVELPVYIGSLDLQRPNARGLNRNVYFRTNSNGIRGPEYEAQPAKGIFRIAVTGDSTTMGSGVLEDDRYTNQLERRLGPGYEILNVGLSGLNTDQVVSRLEQLSRHYESDLFVYGFSTNDIEGPAYKTRSGGIPAVVFAQMYWSAVAELERSPSYFWRFLRARQFEWKSKGAKIHDELLENFLENPRAWESFTAGLDRFAELAHEHAVCAHVLLHADIRDLDENHSYLEVYDRVERAAVERGLTVSQSFPYFEGRNAKALWVSLFDPHPNRMGHAFLAEALHDGLNQLPKECWKLPRRAATLPASATRR